MLKYIRTGIRTIVFKPSVDLPIVKKNLTITITREVADAHWFYRAIPVARQTDGRTMFSVHCTAEFLYWRASSAV